MESAGELVVLAGELAARVKAAEDELDAGHMLGRVHVNRHAAAVIRNLQGAVLIEDNADLRGKPGDSLVNAVVYDLLREVVRPCGLGIHAGTPLDGLKALKDFYRFS